MTIGEKIRKIRRYRKMTQQKLGILCGFSENTAQVRIRQYESNGKKPKIDKLQKIANSLDVHINSLKEAQIISYEDLMFSLFEIEDSFGNIKIFQNDGNILIGIDNLEIDRMLMEFMNKKEELHNGLITEDAYTEWRYNYNSKER